MDDNQFNRLAEKYQAGKATPEEVDFLNAYYKGFELRPDLNEDSVDGEPDKLWFYIKAEIDTKINQQQNSRSKTIRLWSRVVAAASIFLCIGLSFCFFQRNSTVSNNGNIVKRDISPGESRAILTLSNGKKIDLDAIKKGTIVHQGGLTIAKANNGQLVYEVPATKDQSIQNKLSYNTIETPRGGRYTIHLSDGTTVWLNAASSLKYPTQFTANERRVELTGEGYFEVAHDKTKPFKVITSKQEIEVLGTHFNVNAYTDENVTKTTLLEGSVKVRIHTATEIAPQSVTLKPGQQSSLDNTGLNVMDVNADDAIAWQKGYFKFNRESIQSIMRKLSRWYNIDVVYEADKDPVLVFGGKISQTKNLQAILQIMEETGNVHFRIEGRSVIVMQ